MDNQFPDSIKAGCRRLRLPEFQIKGPIQILELAFADEHFLLH
jgi:hypothetical protein